MGFSGVVRSVSSVMTFLTSRVSACLRQIYGESLDWARENPTHEWPPVVGGVYDRCGCVSAEGGLYNL